MFPKQSKILLLPIAIQYKLSFYNNIYEETSNFFYIDHHKWSISNRSAEYWNFLYFVDFNDLSSQLVKIIFTVYLLVWFLWNNLLLFWSCFHLYYLWILYDARTFKSKLDSNRRRIWERWKIISLFFLSEYLKCKWHKILSVY